MKNLALMWVLAGVAVALLAAGDGKPPVSTFTDKRDGKVYKIVKIGSQVWFAENLNYAAEGSVCYERSTDSCAKYGRLYTWETAMKACPAGTHLPTDDEWTTLVDYVGGRKTAGTMLKSSTGWKNKSGVPAGTNEYGFSALPSGRGEIYFYDVSNNGYWWSATEDNTGNAWFRYICYINENVGRYYCDKTKCYFSVRCVLNAEKESQK